MYKAISNDSIDYADCVLSVGNTYDNPLRSKLLKHLKNNVDIRNTSFSNVMNFALFYDSLKDTIKSISFTRYNDKHSKRKEDPTSVFLEFETNKYLHTDTSPGVRRLISDYLTDLETYDVLNEVDKSTMIDAIRIKCRFDPSLRVDGLKLLEKLMERFVCARSNSVDIESEFKHIRIGNSHPVSNVDGIRLNIETLRTVSLFCKDQSRFNLSNAGRQLAAQTDKETLKDMILTLSLNDNIKVGDIRITTDNYLNNFTTTKSFLDEVEKYFKLKKDINSLIKGLILDQSYRSESKYLSNNDKNNSNVKRFQGKLKVKNNETEKLNEVKSKPKKKTQPRVNRVVLKTNEPSDQQIESVYLKSLNIKDKANKYPDLIDDTGNKHTFTNDASDLKARQWFN